MENIESILNEFYHCNTSNFRKKELEVMLKAFQERENSFEIIISNISQSLNSQYLFFFSVSTLEVN
jgi:hypothetical protein